MINQAEGGALPLTCTPSTSPLLLSPPAQFPGRFDYNLWRTFLTAKPLKMCWQMRWPGQLVKPRGCRRPGREGQSERGGKDRTDGAEIEGIMAQRVSVKTDQVCDKTGKLREETPDTPETVTSRQADWQARAPGRPYWSGELCCDACTHSRGRRGDTEAWSGESSLPTVVQGAGIQEPILISSVWAATRGPFISQVEWQNVTWSCVHACALACLFTQAEIVVSEVCRDIKTKGRDDEEHVGERSQRAQTHRTENPSAFMLYYSHSHHF